MPDELICIAEEHVRDSISDPQGRVDLLFRTPDYGFVLLVELKLHSGYGRDQVARYLKTLAVYRNRGGARSRAGLVAVTRNPPAYGEPDRPNEGWLGSVRWTSIYEQLRALEHHDPSVTEVWRTVLSILERQGDIGLKTVDRTAVEAWARAQRGRSQLVDLLKALAPSTIELVRQELATHLGVQADDGLARLVRRGKKQRTFVFPHQTAVHLRIVIPSERRTERLRIQFAADGGKGPRFSVEARHWDAGVLPPEIQDNLHHIAEQLRAAWGLDHVSQLTDFRTYWARSHGVDEWLGDGSGVVDRLLGFIRSDVETLVRSGIFSHETGIGYSRDDALEPLAEVDASVDDVEDG